MSSSNTTTTKNPKSKSQSQSQSQTQEERPHLSANFANPSSQRIDYDHEVYLHLMSGDDGDDTRKDKNRSKTPNQVYRENIVRRHTTRALDPAVVDPNAQRDPSPLDLEWAESQRVRERLVGN
ncbi:hypothetical protein AtubIFM54640_001635 [Aspergillus tubingensis]|nr:hypothetical protein AtubIFM54640_001635 [Aspergillus tubingensis]